MAQLESYKLLIQPNRQAPVTTQGLSPIIRDLQHINTELIDLTNLVANLPTSAGLITAVANTANISLAVGAGILTADLTATGVAAAMYGDATNVPQITVDANGRITLAANVPITFPSAALSAGLIGFGSGANVLTGDATFAWDNTNKNFNITGTISEVLSNTNHVWYVAHGNVGYWFTDSTSTGLLSHQGFGIDMKTTEKYTMGAVGLANNNYFEINDSASTATLSTLAGVGSRMVIASATGALSTTAIPAGTVTSVGATAPITSSGGATPTISTSMTTNRLIGRSTAGSGVMEEIVLGTGLSFTGLTLNVSYPAAFISSVTDTTEIDLTVAAGALSATWAANQGTVNQTLHGNAAGLPAWSSVVEGDFGFTDITTANSATTQHGLLKKLSNVATQYMDGSGNWSVPVGSGGTVTSVSGTLNRITSSGGATPTIDISATFEALLEKVANKDATGGYVGMTLFKTNFKNAANTFTSFFTNSNTAAHTYTFKDADGTIAFTSDIPSVTPAALTKTDDTNVTLTLGGTPTTALLQATSITVGWTGTLADGRIASAATWNAKQATISVTTPITLTGASVGIVNQGTTTQVLHGNAAGNASFSSVVEADLGLTDLTTANVSNTAHGFMPKLIANRAYYVDNSGAWTPFALGAAGTVYTSNGATSAPTFAAAGGTTDVLMVQVFS